ncbi:MAG: hypothetical protein AAGD10_16705 [Myxococcota bacterium]
MSRGELVQILLSARVKVTDAERARIKEQLEYGGPLPMPFLIFARRILRRGGLHGSAFAFTREIRLVCRRRIGLVRGVMQGCVSLVPDERLLAGNLARLEPLMESPESA